METIKPFACAGITALFILLSVSQQVSAKQTTLVALFGDSITYGYNVANGCTTTGSAMGVNTSSNNCPRLDLNTQFAGPPKRTVTLSNWGFGGTSSLNGRTRIVADLSDNSDMYADQGCQLDGSADLCFVLIKYGTNDQAFNISASTTGFNIGEMIVSARSLNYEPIVATLIPRTGFSVVAQNNAIIAKANSPGFNAFIVDLYHRFVTQPGGYQTLMELDGGGYLHPNETGYLAIAEEWFEKRLVDVIEPDPVTIAPIIYLLLDD